jgi:hypothetical protein
MGRISYTQVNNLPDTMDTTAFELLFGQVPGAGDTRDLTIKCQTAVIPGFSNEAWESNLHGYVRRFRGRKTFSRQLSVTFIETADGGTYRKLKQWDEYIAGTRTGNSQGYQRDYSVIAELNVYTTTGDIANTVKFINLFVQEVSDVTLDGNSSQAMTVSVVFSFDNIEVGGVPLL